MPERYAQFFLERPRVERLLETAVEHPVVFVIAGEGYGKTTAVHFFLRGRKDTVAWMPLSENDRDPWYFWETLIKAEGYSNPRIRRALGEIGFPETRGQNDHLHKIMEDAFPENKKHIIVADNCHLVGGERLSDFIKQFLAFPLPQKTFIMISRTEPELNTLNLLSKGLLFRINSGDLCFNKEEIREYFRLKNIALTGEEAKNIFTATEGWIQAISLIAREMKNKSSACIRPFLGSGGFRSIIDDVFAPVSVSLRRFLITLSLFDHWPAEALEKISSSLQKLSAEKNISPIEELAGKTDLLSSLVSYDTYLNGYTIHRSFLDFLREKQEELSAEEIKTARVIMARWCNENKLYIYAAMNYGKAGDYAELIKTIYSFPRLMSGTAAVSLLEIIDQILKSGDRNEDDENFLFLRHVTRAGLLINMGRYAESRAALERSIGEFEALPPCRLTSWILSACYNSMASLFFISCRRTGEVSRAAECFRRGNYYFMRYPYAVSGPSSRASAGSYMLSVGNPPAEGEYEAFIQTIAECIPHASYSLGGYLSGADSLCKAELFFFKGDLNNAERYAREAVFKSREKGQYEIESKSLFYLYRIHLCNGNAPACRETWEQIEVQLNITDYFNRYAIYDIAAGWLSAHSGCTEKIAPWLKNEFEESDLNLSFHNFESMVKAKSLFAEKKYEEALEFIGRKKVREGIGSFHLGLLEITVLEAVIRNRSGDEGGALKTLETAYAISLVNSFDMPFIELGEDMRILAGMALGAMRRVIPAYWLETIRNRASVYAKKLGSVIEQLRLNGADEIPFLTSRELAILAGISRGLTREEISRNESIPVHSVKTGIKTIYGKLGAFNRASAIRIATGMGLLNGKDF